MNELMVINKKRCRLCGKLCRSNVHLSQHVRFTHKLLIKDYYDLFLKKIGEGFCLVCGKNTRYHDFRYDLHCSVKCTGKSSHSKNHRKETNIKNYGCDNPRKSLKIKKKMRSRYFDKTGYENPSQNPNVKKITEDRVFNKTGFKNVSQIPSIIKRAKITRKNTMIKRGHWVPDSLISSRELYYRSVWQFSELSLKKKYSSDQLKKRTGVGVDGGLHADHKFSIKEGFMNNIIPSIIGCESNMELIPWRINISKKAKCSITKEELFKLYDQETQGVK